MKSKSLIPLTAGFLTILLATASSAFALNFTANFTTAQGYVSGSLASSTQTGAPNFTLAGNGGITVNPTAGTATNSIVGVEAGPSATFKTTTGALGSSGTVYTVTTQFTLGSGSFEDGSHGGYGPELSMSSGAAAEVYSQSIGSYRFITESGNSSIGIPTGITTHTLQIQIVETVGSGNSMMVTDTLTDITTNTVLSTTTGSLTNMGNQSAGFSGVYDPTAAFTSFSTSWGGTSSGSGGGGSSGTFTANFTTAQGYVSGSLASSTQTGAPNFMLAGSGGITVNPTAGTATNSIVGVEAGPAATYKTTTGALGSSGTVYTVTTNLVLGTGDFDDSHYGGFGPELSMSSGAAAEIYSQSNGNYRFITESGNNGIGTPAGIKTDTYQIKIVETVGSGGTMTVVDTLTDLTTNTVVNTTSGSLTNMANQSAGFSGVYDPTVAFTSFSTSWGGTSSGSGSGSTTTWAFNTASNPATGYTAASLGSQPISMVVYTGATTVTPGSGGTFASATGASGFYYNSDAPAATGQTVTESATFSLGSNAQNNIFGGGYQSGVVTFQLWTGPNAANGASMAVLALYGQGGTSYNAMFNGGSENSSLTINPSDVLVFKIADNVGAGPSGQDALTATITDNGATIYTATLNVATSSDHAYSYRMLNGASTITFTNLALGVSSSGGSGGGVTAPVITSATSASGTTGTAFSYTITASNSPTSYSETGTLPAGLGISGAVISGTPTTAGTSSITIKATNSAGTGSATLTFTIGAALNPPVITSSTSASGTVGTAFSYTITATNSPTGYSYTGTLPAGLSFNSGVISGTPTASGVSSITIKATNSVGTGSATLTLTINSNGGGGSGSIQWGTPPSNAPASQPGPAGSPVLTAPTVSYLEAGIPAGGALTATNNPTSVSATGLPNGLSVSLQNYPGLGGNIGVISGTLNDVPGTYVAEITVGNAVGSGTFPYVIIVGTAQTGSYFTTYQDGNGVWWLKDPNGNLVISKGMDGAGIGAYAPNPGYADYWNFDNAIAQFKTAEAYQIHEDDQMLGSGFNTIGSWGSDNLGGPMPGTPQTMAFINTPQVGSSYTNYINFPDVFQPGWAAFCQSSGPKTWAGCEWLIGSFSDNELNWGYEWDPGTGNDNDFTAGTNLLWRFLGASQSPGYAVAQNMLQSEYNGSISQLNAAWNTSFSSWSSLGGNFVSNTGRPAHACWVDSNNFAGMCAQLYFSAVYQGFKAVDPHHLVLGCRFASGSHPLPAVVAAESQYVDAISFNCYGFDPTADIQWYTANETRNVPVIIGEFEFSSSADNSSGATQVGSGPDVANQQARATAFENYVQSGMACKNLIGYAWCFYSDGPPGGINFGVIDSYGNPYAALNQQMAITNPQAESMHTSANH